MSKDDLRNDFNKPVAYDAEGRPLYAHPTPVQQVATNNASSPPVVHVSRPLEPDAIEISPALKEKHEQSIKRHPHLDLSEHEYVVLNIRRHPIGLVLPLTITIAMICMFSAGLILLPDLLQKTSLELSMGNISAIYLAGIVLITLLGVGMYIIYWVYINNRYYITNESVIEKVQISLFSSNERTVGLGDVVDVSCSQKSIIEQIFNYGTVEVGTKDDSVSYVFHTVGSPNQQASVIKDVVECFKNGRPIGLSMPEEEEL